MRLAAFAFAAVVTLAGAGPGRADAASETVARLRAQLALQPGKFVGCIPGGCLRPYMQPRPTSVLNTVPVLAVDTFCKGNLVCINSEQSAYNDIKSVWKIIDENDRDICILTARDLSNGGSDATFYKRLAACVGVRLDTKTIVERYAPKSFQP